MLYQPAVAVAAEVVLAGRITFQWFQELRILYKLGVVVYGPTMEAILGSLILVLYMGAADILAPTPVLGLMLVQVAAMSATVAVTDIVAVMLMEAYLVAVAALVGILVLLTEASVAPVDQVHRVIKEMVVLVVVVVHFKHQVVVVHLVVVVVVLVFMDLKTAVPSLAHKMKVLPLPVQAVFTQVAAVLADIQVIQVHMVAHLQRILVLMLVIHCPMAVDMAVVVADNY
jgi:hypothetical protein